MRALVGNLGVAFVFWAYVLLPMADATALLFAAPLFVTAFFAAIQQVAKTRAYRLAEASLLAPYTYTAIIWAALAGWLLWREFPSPAVIAGTLVVIASNLFNAWREVR